MDDMASLLGDDDLCAIKAKTSVQLDPATQQHVDKDSMRTLCASLSGHYKHKNVSFVVLNPETLRGGLLRHVRFDDTHLCVFYQCPNSQIYTAAYVNCRDYAISVFDGIVPSLDRDPNEWADRFTRIDNLMRELAKPYNLAAIFGAIPVDEPQMDLVLWSTSAVSSAPACLAWAEARVNGWAFVPSRPVGSYVLWQPTFPVADNGPNVLPHGAVPWNVRLMRLIEGPGADDDIRAYFGPIGFDLAVPLYGDTPDIVVASLAKATFQATPAHRLPCDMYTMQTLCRVVEELVGQPFVVLDRTHLRHGFAGIALQGPFFVFHLHSSNIWSAARIDGGEKEVLLFDGLDSQPSAPGSDPERKARLDDLVAELRKRQFLPYLQGPRRSYLQTLAEAGEEGFRFREYRFVCMGDGGTAVEGFRSGPYCLAWAGMGATGRVPLENPWGGGYYCYRGMSRQVEELVRRPAYERARAAAPDLPVGLIAAGSE